VGAYSTGGVLQDDIALDSLAGSRAERAISTESVTGATKRGRAASGQLGLALLVLMCCGLDPAKWTPTERQIRCPTWTKSQRERSRYHGVPAGPSPTSFEQAPSILSLMRARRSPRSLATLDLTQSALRTWVERARADRSKGKTGLTTAEREELTKLRKQVRELTMERDILKEAAVIFAKHRR